MKNVLLRRDGITIWIGLIAMAFLLGFAALAVDLGALYLARQQLQSATNAAALAGVAELRHAYDPLNRDIDTAAAILAITETAAANRCLGDPVELNAATDIEIGTYDASTNDIVAWDPTIGTVGVRVRAQRVLPTWFAFSLGIREVTISAEPAVATLDPQNLASYDPQNPTPGFVLKPR